MLHFLTQTTKYSDRINLDLHIGPYENTDDTCGKFVLINNGSIKSTKFHMFGSFGCYTNEKFKLIGDTCLTIRMPGINTSNSTLSLVNSKIPGALAYIDGCSNSVIVPPFRNGEPCINYLYFPNHIKQTTHIHPSVRIGVVLDGSGRAETDSETHILTTGSIFLLDRFTKHRFCTSDNHMSLLVFHPDSEGGPTDESNPMILRTYINTGNL